jgi:dihydrofolate reductase
VLIAALAQGRVIGRAGTLPWHLPADLAHFRQVTMGAPVLMGRRTWASLPERFRPLPGRTNIVLTRQPGWQPESLGAPGHPGVLTVASLPAALAAVAELRPAPARVFVIGGAELYAQALPLADGLELTEIDLAVPDGDAHFPAWSTDDWEEVAREAHGASATSPHAHAFVTWRRRGG